MQEIMNFVDSFCDYYNKNVFITEDEQVLPSKEVLNSVCSTLLNASCIRDELRFSSFRVCFLPEDADYLDTFVYAHRLRLEKPIPFTVEGLHKLAPAINPEMSYLCVDTSRTPFTVTGIIASYTSWEKMSIGDKSDGNRMPMIPNLYVKSPGEIDGCFGEKTLVSYSFGKTVISRPDVFISGYVANELRNGSDVPQEELCQFLSRVLWRVDSYEHGGAILIVPSEEVCKKYVGIKYKLPCKYLYEEDKSLITISQKAREKELSSYADFIAKLTTVDGAVLLTKNLDLIGFGVEILTDKMGKREPAMCFLKNDDTDDETKRFNDNGTRHRSGYRFAYEVDHSVVIICSQDGAMKACTKKDERVVVYNNISFSLI